ncbi:stalk domain-containing protein [Tepidibacter formicigenes]|jgi:N-acetylmuramoyl-L-alanine amidase|uniref:LysM domain-containing protein n=1 Tax=Tepidibacter formicigenes DSM 15518 TaxID=1123349 RepID=A0A1M6JLF4_9FIRM|nr:stalk domain-containing protein [Tepidibacter formicigenes]SHJ47470.1 LysM domain-containing protein [Tepidibacter formicigenes DSM 15518]
MKKILSSILCVALLFGNTTSYAQSYIMHTIKSNDTYMKISQQYNKNIYELENLNKNLGNILYEGSLMKIEPLNQEKTISIKVDGNTISTDQDPYLENSRTFVPIRFIAEALDIDEINWDDNTQNAILKNENTTIKLPIHSNKAVINGKEITLDAPTNIYNGRTFVPIRFIAEAFNCNVNWDDKNYTVNINTNKSVQASSTAYTKEDLYWLSRLVQAEAQGEPYEGKLAVANVIINRKNSSLFPNSIREVIFDQKYGFQYTPVANGEIYNFPSDDSIKAAKEALEGYNNIGNCLYFLNPNTSTNFWIVQNRTFYIQIENHDFYL